MKITLIGLDLAQSSIQVCLRDERGQITKNRGMSPAKAKELLANTPPAMVAMEACGSAHWWGRLAQRHGHEVRLLPPQHVKAFRRIHRRPRCAGHRGGRIAAEPASGARQVRRPAGSGPLGPVA